MIRIKKMYKIHHVSVARGLGRSAGNDTFYETEEEALDAARSYVSLPNTARGMVIYKAHVLVRPSKPPVEILEIRHDGKVITL